MFVKCIKSRFPDLFVVDEIYDIETLISRTNDIQYIYDEDGDPWFFYNDLDTDDFEYIPPITYRDVDDFMAEHDDEDDDYD
ncbi:TPA: hypothetical protein KKL06_000434 [Escherichia coli]|nr:hypothetical protein [Escherichia coli]